MIKLSKRLAAAVSLVPQGFAVCDVGCDHGYTSIALVERGISPCAAASDVRKGPLAAAAQNIETFGLSGKIKTVLADGVPKTIRELLPENVPRPSSSPAWAASSSGTFWPVPENCF